MNKIVFLFMISPLLFITFALNEGAKSYAGTDSINPKRMIHPLFKVYGKYEVIDEKNLLVPGIKFDELAINDDQKYINEGEKNIIPREFYDNAKELSKSVFETQASNNKHSMGSSVHAGQNLILTAYHVYSAPTSLSLSSSRRKKRFRCKRFAVKLNENQDNQDLRCAKVHFCNPELDYCLIEMNESGRYALANQQAPNLKVKPELSMTKPTIAIGNPLGYGLHASMGKGSFLENSIDWIYFYAPVFSGNSGGALYNLQGDVIGLVNAQSTERYSDNAFNVATPLSSIKEDLEKNMGKDHPVLKDINWVE